MIGAEVRASRERHHVAVRYESEVSNYHNAHATAILEREHEIVT